MKNGHNKLTPLEQRIFDAVKAAKWIDTTKLLAKVYPGRSKRPVSASIILSLMLRSVERKTRRGPLRLKRSGRCGPYPQTVWLERM